MHRQASLELEASPTTVMDAIYGRRSVRAYTAEPLDRATIRALLAAAVRAPTAVHAEPWAFVIVQNRHTLKRLSDRAKPLFLEQARLAHLDRGGHALDIFASPDFNIFYDAGTLIVICSTASGPFVVADCWLAAQNLMLAAWAIGLGTCVVGSAVPVLNTSEVKRELGIPAEGSAIAPIVVGVPADVALPTTRKEPQILQWLGRNTTPPL